MTQTTSPPESLLDGFLFASKATVIGKIAQFDADGPQKMHVVSDFDLTLTAGKVPGQNAGTWDVMDELMPPEGVAKHTEIYQSFRPFELANQLTEQIAIEKWSETLDLIVSYHMKISDVREAFLAVASLRDGAKALFDACEASKVPTVVLSSGIRAVIQEMADYYKIQPMHILSNELVVGEDGRIQGWQPDTLIHIMNKNERGHTELSSLRDTRPNVILLGDVPDDTKMVTGDTVLRIRVLDPRKGEAHIVDEALAASYTAGYDLVVQHDLSPVANLVQWFCQHRV